MLCAKQTALINQFPDLETFFYLITDKFLNFQKCSVSFFCAKMFLLPTNCFIIFKTVSGLLDTMDGCVVRNKAKTRKKHTKERWQ